MRALFPLSVLFLLLAGCGPSENYSDVRTTHVDSQLCTDDQSTSHWPVIPVTIYVQKVDPKIHNVNGVLIDFVEHESIVEGTELAVRAWNNAAGKQLLVFGGLIDKQQPMKSSDALSDGDLVVYMQSNWNDSFISKTPNILATAYIYDSCDGKTIEASDIFLNTQQYYFYDNVKYAGVQDDLRGLAKGQRKIVDAASLIIHEIGHSLGLGHTPEKSCPESVMIPTLRVDPNYAKRDLAKTDVANIIDLYEDVR